MKSKNSPEDPSEKGKEIRPQPGPQELFLSSPADIIIYGGSAGGGKLLPLNTPLPTPSGWVTMGEVKVGDALFDEKGNVCYITEVFDIVESPGLYHFTFDDGTEIDSCKDHLWKTFTAKDLNALTKCNDEWRAKRREKRPSRATGNKSEAFVKSITERNKTTNRPPTKPAPEGTVKTTLEIVQTLTVGKNRRRNHAIKVPDALNLPEVELPIDPYTLGLWLGDGTRCQGTITTADPELTEGWVKVKSQKYLWRVPGLTHELKQTGVLNNKHVPEIYLRASREQRLALLQGLMDTDGTVKNGSGSVQFDNTDECLVDAVIELACSLGYKPGRKTSVIPILNGKKCKECFSVSWTTEEPVFRLERKLKLQKPKFRRTNLFRYITKAEKIESRPGRCIAVSSPSRLYLAGKRMIPTHNSWSLLLEPLRHKDVKGFTSTIFRRTYPQITNEGGLWDTSMEIYPHAGGIPRESDVRWKFPSGNSIKFAHLEHEKSKLEYQGSQICYIAFDELTHFSEGQFFYLLSRNRSTCGIRPYMRATCNPDPDSWVAEFIAWWIDQETGYPILERSGVIRYFVRHLDNIYWADSKDELWDKVQDMIPEDDFRPQSFTFISASLDDNPALTEKDPGYKGKLMALPLVERERLLGGNWKIRHTAGTMFRIDWFHYIDRSEVPEKTSMQVDGEPEIMYLPNENRKIRGKMRKVRWWDTAATEPSPENKDPDWTAGVLMGELDGKFYILDLVHVQKSPGDVEDLMAATAELDGKSVEIGMEVEPGSAGKREAERFRRTIFSGYTFHAERSSGDKVTRAKPFSSAVQHDLVYIVRAPWNNEYLSDLINFPNPKYHDDCVDASSAPHDYLTRKGSKKTKGLSALVRTR